MSPPADSHLRISQTQASSCDFQGFPWRIRLEFLATFALGCTTWCATSVPYYNVSDPAPWRASPEQQTVSPEVQMFQTSLSGNDEFPSLNLVISSKIATKYPFSGQNADTFSQRFSGMKSISNCSGGPPDAIRP